MTILKYTQADSPYKVLCMCDCGNTKEFYLSNIVPKPNARYTKSCGCQRIRIVSEKNTKHGLSKSKFYKRWRSMFDRCLPSYICSSSYTGISVSSEWKDFGKFKDDMYKKYLEHKKINGERNTTLDRVNPYKNYSKENCRWATMKQQANNKKINYDVS